MFKLGQDIATFSSQWKKFYISLFFSDNDLFLKMQGFNTTDMPKLISLPGDILTFCDTNAAEIERLKQSNSLSQMNDFLKGVKTFCCAKSTDFQGIQTHLDKVRSSMTNGIKDIDGTLSRDQATISVLSAQIDDIVWQYRYTKDQFPYLDPIVVAEANHPEIVDWECQIAGLNLQVAKLSFTKSCIDDLLTEVEPIANEFSIFLSNFKGMVSDIDDGLVELDDVADFITVLRSS